MAEETNNGFIIKRIDNTEIKARDENGGSMVITSISPDRSNDIVQTSNINTANYMRNPIILNTHKIHDIKEVVGKTIMLDRSQNDMTASFMLRPSVNEFDPQGIILMMWRNEFIKAASIQFKALEQPEINELGGRTFGATELLEWSFVSVPDNQDALRLAYNGVKQLGKKMICGLGEICKSGELSESIVKSLISDLGVKKFSIPSDIMNKEKDNPINNVLGIITDAKDMPNNNDDEARDRAVALAKSAIKTHAILTEEKDDIMGGDMDNITQMSAIFKELNSGLITQSQAKFMLKSLADIKYEGKELDALVDTSGIKPKLVDEVKEVKEVEKTFTQTEVDQMIAKVEEDLIDNFKKVLEKEATNG